MNIHNRCSESTVGIIYSIAPIIQNTIWVYYLCKFRNCRDRRDTPVGNMI